MINNQHSLPTHSNFDLAIIACNAEMIYVLVDLHSPLPLPVITLDETEHTDARPFCANEFCPCHADGDAWEEFIGEPLREGLLTEAEAQRIFLGQHLPLSC